MSVNSIPITDNFLLFSKQLYWLLKLTPHWKRLYVQITRSFKCYFYRNCISFLYFLCVIWALYLKIILRLQKKKIKNTAYIHLIQMKENQWWHVLDLERLVEESKERTIIPRALKWMELILTFGRFCTGCVILVWLMVVLITVFAIG